MDEQTFRHQFVPELMDRGKVKAVASVACGKVWTICRGIQTGDWVLFPQDNITYRIGKMAGEYHFVEGKILPHRRPVHWLETPIFRQALSQPLRALLSTPGTLKKVTHHGLEIESLIAEPNAAFSAEPEAMSADVDDPVVFALEKQLEEFLVHNWQHTALGQQYVILEQDGERIGQQYPTDTGRIDILAVSKDNATLLVVELKRGRASDKVVGQIQRYS